jgi:hypothetical protein
MLNIGKRLLALLCATGLFAIYYMFLGVIDTPQEDGSILEVMFVLSFLYGGLGIFTYGLAVSYVTDLLLRSFNSLWKHVIAFFSYCLFGFIADRWILQIDTPNIFAYFSTTSALFVYIFVELFEFMGHTNKSKELNSEEIE